MREIEYEGIFCREAANDLIQKLRIVIPEGWSETFHKHVTTSFAVGAPHASDDPSMLGTIVKIRVATIAYSDKYGIGFGVLNIECDNPSVSLAFKRMSEQQPAHITIANPPGVEPVMTAQAFKDGDVKEIGPFVIEGRYSVFLKGIGPVVKL